MQHVSRWPAACAVLVTSLVAGCGGGGGGGKVAVEEPVVAVDLGDRRAAEGFWFGRTASGGWADLIILEDGSTWGVQADETRITGGMQGTSQAVQGRFSATLVEYNFHDLSAPQVTYAGTVTPRLRIDAQATEGRSLALEYDPAYEQPASTEALAGRYALDGNTVLTLGADGAFHWSADADCTLAGRATPRASGRNVFDLALTYVGQACFHGDGTRIHGVAYLDAGFSPPRLVSLALREDGGVGFISRAEKIVESTPPQPQPQPEPEPLPGPSPQPEPVPEPEPEPEPPRIPAGHYPPPGTCRIWILGLSPGQQSPPGDCSVLQRQVPPGAVLIRG